MACNRIPKGLIGIENGLTNKYKNKRTDNGSQLGETHFYWNGKNWRALQWTKGAGDGGANGWKEWDFDASTDAGKTELGNWFKNYGKDAFVSGFTQKDNTLTGTFDTEENAKTALGNNYSNFNIDGEVFHGLRGTQGNSAIGTVGGRASALDAVDLLGYKGTLRNEDDWYRANKKAIKANTKFDLKTLRKLYWRGETGMDYAAYLKDKKDFKKQRQSELNQNKDAYVANTRSIMNTRLGKEVAPIKPVVLNTPASYTRTDFSRPSSTSQTSDDLTNKNTSGTLIGTFTGAKKFGGSINYAKFFNGGKLK